MQHLQTSFFYNPENGVRQRILSGQHMLQMNLVPKEEKEEIADVLLEIAEDEEEEYNARADAADVVYRLVVGEKAKRARYIITKVLGYHAINSTSVGVTGNIINSSSLLDRTKTIYSNQQNVHEVEECVDNFIEKMINDTSIKPRAYHEVHQIVSDFIRSLELDSKKRHAAYKALNRVSVDTATFTEHNVTISEIFVHVWARIERLDDELQLELQKRFVDELCDMSDTCSSGHSARFVNVLSVTDNSLCIKWDEQIKANIAGRLNARVRDHPDPDIRAQISLVMI